MSRLTSTGEGVLKSLRAMMPARPLSFFEACQRAEAQANRLLDLHGMTGPAVPCEIVTELPHIRVEQVYDIPVSGSALWDGTSWVLTLNAADYLPRRRFSLMHEFKHVLDHPFRRIFLPGGNPKAEEAFERVADYFAACVLMPKAWVKTAFFGQSQSVERLASIFEVSRAAMNYRLNELGLTEPTPRCRTPWPGYFRQSDRDPHSYHREPPTIGVTT
jgi:hypothetical protein